jgi:hypothetical protein
MSTLELSAVGAAQAFARENRAISLLHGLFWPSEVLINEWRHRLIRLIANHRKPRFGPAMPLQTKSKLALPAISRERERTSNDSSGAVCGVIGL